MIYELLWKAFSGLVRLAQWIDDSLYGVYFKELSKRMQWSKNKRDAGWEE